MLSRTQKQTDIKVCAGAITCTSEYRCKCLVNGLSAAAIKTDNDETRSSAVNLFSTSPKYWEDLGIVMLPGQKVCDFLALPRLQH